LLNFSIFDFFYAGVTVGIFSREEETKICWGKMTLFFFASGPGSDCQ
jgi:hypothetical protein